MIDIENKVIDTVKKAVSASGSSASVYSDYVDVPSSFPCVTVMETDNTSFRDTMDEELKDHHSSVTYEVNVYTNNVPGKLSAAKKLCETVDSAMLGMKFTRIMRMRTPNVERTIYRITMRYTAIVAEGVTDGSDTVFHLYRN